MEKENQKYLDLKDEEIILLVQKGNSHIFGIIIERYTDKLNRYLKKIPFKQRGIRRSFARYIYKMFYKY